MRDLQNGRPSGLLIACGLSALLAMAAAPVNAQQAETAPSASPATAVVDAEVPTAPVTLDGVTLFRVRGTSSFPPADRAQRIRDQITAAAADPSVDPASVRVVDAGGLARIVAGDKPLLTVINADAEIEGVGRTELATIHALRVRQAMTDYRAARSTAALTRAAWRTAGALIVLTVILLTLLTLWRRLDRALTRRLNARIHAIGIQSFEVMRAEQIHGAITSAFFTIRVLIALGSLLLLGGYILAQWPATREFSQDSTEFALAPLRVLGNGLMANIPSVVFLVVLYVVVRVVLRLTRLFFQAVEQRSVAFAGFDPEWAQPTYKLVRIAIVAFALIVAYPYIPGSKSEAFKGISLFIGIVFSLGSSSAIANIIAGYMMTYRRAFRIGDRVKIGDSIGEVIDIRLQVTHLRSLKNEEIVIPNSQILSNEVLNYSSLAKDRGLILHSDVGIGYETPWRQVEAMLLTAAARTPGLGSKPPPFVLIKSLGDFAVVYELNVPCGELTSLQQQYTALHHHVLDVFNEHGVQIMTPAYEGDPAEPKIVPPKDWYTAPARLAEDDARRRETVVP